MGSNQPATYTLPRDADESLRLEHQHQLYVQALGHLLHPTIASSLPPSARIADVGTGTGAWLRDLAPTCPPDWTLTGLDISAAQFPSPTPTDRRTFQIFNILEPVPEDLKAQFDCVHLRMLTLGLSSAGDWAAAARHALDLLKPGGWIQWHEGDFNYVRSVQQVPGASTEANDQLTELILAPLARMGKIEDHVPRLRATLASAGFEETRRERFSSDRLPELRPQITDVQLRAEVSVARMMAAAGMDVGLTADGLEDLVRRCWEEVEGGKTYYRWDMYVMTGRKPMS